MGIKPKKSTNTCCPENSTGWTNGGLEEPVEKESAESILVLLNHLIFAMLVKATTKEERLTHCGGSLCKGHPAESHATEQTVALICYSSIGLMRNPCHLSL